MRKSGKGQNGKHRSVIARKQRQNISQEPEMVELKELYKDMNEQEKERTRQYLKVGNKQSNSDRGI